METYTLIIEMPWRPIAHTLQAVDDGQAVQRATEMVSATCAEINGLGDYRAKVTRADGSDVFEPVSISALIATGDAS